MTGRLTWIETDYSGAEKTEAEGSILGAKPCHPAERHGFRAGDRLENRLKPRNKKRQKAGAFRADFLAFEIGLLAFC